MTTRSAGEGVSAPTPAPPMDDGPREAAFRPPNPNQSQQGGRDGRSTSNRRPARMTEQPAIMSELKRSEKRVEWGAAALGASLLLQTAGIVWWGAKIDQRVSNLEEKISATASAGETIARLDERTAAMQTSIDRIYTQIEADQSGSRK